MITLSPKALFQKTNAAKAHADLCANDQFKHVLQVTMAHMVFDSAVPSDPEEAANLGFKLAGAREYVHHLLNLAEVPEPRKPDYKQNLTHTN
jgi:hypothetical protein